MAMCTAGTLIFDPVEAVENLGETEVAFIE